MNARKIRENLGRVKSSCMRGEVARAVFLVVGALKELGGQTAPTDLRSDFRNALADLVAIPEVKAVAGKALNYAPGSERELLQKLSAMYRTMVGQESEEEYQAALQRKLKLDHCFRDGKKFLDEGKPSEADGCFAEALKYYRDETAIFGMMARAMLEAGEPVRALGHVRAGLKVMPDDAGLDRLAAECAAMRK